MPLLSCFIENKTVKKNRYVYFIKLASQNVKSARFSAYLPELGPPPPLGPRGETHSLAGEGVGGPNSNEGTDTLVLYVYYKLLYVSLWRYTEFHTWKKSRNSVKFRGISRNYMTRSSAEFRRNCSQFRTEYGIDGSKKNRRNSVSAEFRGHPTFQWYHSHADPFWPDGTFKGEIKILNLHLKSYCAII